jgi:hypothetical protein
MRRAAGEPGQEQGSDQRARRGRLSHAGRVQMDGGKAGQRNGIHELDPRS